MPLVRYKLQELAHNATNHRQRRRTLRGMQKWLLQVHIERLGLPRSQRKINVELRRSVIELACVG